MKSHCNSTTEVSAVRRVNQLNSSIVFIVNNLHLSRYFILNLYSATSACNIWDKWNWYFVFDMITSLTRINEVVHLTGKHFCQTFLLLAVSPSHLIVSASYLFAIQIRTGVWDEEANYSAPQSDRRGRRKYTKKHDGMGRGGRTAKINAKN